MRALVALMMVWSSAACGLVDALAGDGPPEVDGEGDGVGEGEGEAGEGEAGEGEAGEGEAGEGEGEGEIDDANCGAGALLGARAVAVSFSTSCVIQCDGALRCFGEYAAPDPVSGGFDDVTMGQSFVCGHASSGAVRCRGSIDEPAGTPALVRAAQSFLCTLDDGGALSCDGELDWPGFSLPSGNFSDLAAGWGYVCGVARVDGRVRCGGTFSPPQAPALALSSVGVGSRFACGLDGDQHAVCFDEDGVRSDLFHDDAYVALGVGDGTACAIRDDDGALVCASEVDEGALIVSDIPPGAYLSVAVASGHACAIRDDHAVVCWGNDLYGRTAVPSP
jgi:hypothetical protein